MIPNVWVAVYVCILYNYVVYLIYVTRSPEGARGQRNHTTLGEGSLCLNFPFSLPLDSRCLDS